MSYSSLGTQVWHVLTRDHTVLPASHMFIHKWPLLSSQRASLHFGQYSFPIPLRAGGLVGLGGFVKYWGGLPTQRQSLPLILLLLPLVRLLRQQQLLLLSVMVSLSFFSRVTPRFGKVLQNRTFEDNCSRMDALPTIQPKLSKHGRFIGWAQNSRVAEAQWTICAL